MWPGWFSCVTKELGQHCIIEAALVRDRQAVVVQGDSHDASSMAKGVVDEDVDDLSDEPWRGVRDRSWRRAFTGSPFRLDDRAQLSAGGVELMAPVGAVIADELAEIDLGSLAAGAATCQCEQFIECVRQAFYLQARLVGVGSYGGIRVGGQHFELQADARQAGA